MWILLGSFTIRRGCLVLGGSWGSLPSGLGILGAGLVQFIICSWEGDVRSVVVREERDEGMIESTPNSEL